MLYTAKDTLYGRSDTNFRKKRFTPQGKKREAGEAFDERILLEKEEDTCVLGKGIEGGERPLTGNATNSPG